MSDMDREANRFALELLMPHDWIISDIKKMGGIDLCGADGKIEKLAVARRRGHRQAALEVDPYDWHQRIGRRWHRRVCGPCSGG